MVILKYAVLDAFTSQPFGGNPAGVLVLPQALPERTMQLIARELNLSETAFITPTPGTQTFELRWFSPLIEIPLCGHATLASARALGLAGEVVFRTRVSGDLRVRALEGGKYEMEFPAGEVEPATGAVVARVEAAVANAGLGGVTVEFVGIGKGDAWNRFVIVRLPDAASFDLAAQKIRPDDFRPLYESDGLRCIVLTQRVPPNHASGKQFFSRVFAPASGIPEDPVTGSAHCVLTPYWSTELDRVEAELQAKQVSARGGDLELVWVKEKGTVKLRGDVVEVLKGDLTVPDDLL